ncbi:MAG: hypothetical protein AAF392_02790 [Bacteroidota bacterium]
MNWDTIELWDTALVGENNSDKVEFGVEQKKFIAKAGDLVIAGPYVKRRFKALKDSHLLVINSPSGPSEGFIREVTNSPKGYIPNENDKQRFIEKYKIHIVAPE